jgi:hypothetical protein
MWRVRSPVQARLEAVVLVALLPVELLDLPCGISKAALDSLQLSLCNTPPKCAHRVCPVSSQSMLCLDT